ncbi:hypothetical protein D1007_45516 [Hordeum vulgare]|nr:hypothetical protein D1007_45516 [Hordeum vulgare]
MAETDAQRLWRINVEQLRLGIEQSELEAAEVERVAKLMRKQDCIVRQCHGYIVISSSSCDRADSDGSDVDPPPAADGYNIAGNRKGKGSARKW